MSPLHNNEWVQQLHASRRATDQLVALVLLRCGPALNVQWLDLLLAHGPRTGIPGLLTIYDIDRFAREAEPLVESILDGVPPTNRLTPEESISPPDELGYVMTQRVRRRRRCRVGVYLALCAVAQRHPGLFAKARAWEIARRVPPSTF